MSLKFPSESWTVAFRDAVNNNAVYRTQGKDWTFGAVAMIIEANPTVGLPESVGMVLDVHQGECRGTRYVRGDEAAAAAPFVIVAPYERWKEVVEGKIEPIKAMMQGKLKLTKGHLPTIIRFVEASRALVNSASQVPTEFLA